MTSSPDDPPIGPRLTREQRAALDVRGASVALSSGAGCGKTTVLTSRFLATLEPGDGPPTYSAVAMTFTEKAARELRKRVRDACRDRLDRAGDGVDAGHWRGVLRALEAAPVSTFHQYCGEVLRRHGFRLGIDPEFQVLDASLAATLRAHALGRTLRRWLADTQEDLVALSVEYGLSRVRDGIDVLIDARGAGALEDWTARTEDEVIELWKTAWERLGRPLAVRTLNDAAHRLRRLFAAQEFEAAKLRELGAVLLAELLDIERISRDPGRLDALRETAKLPRLPKGQAWPSEEFKETCRGAMEAFRKAVDTFKKVDDDDEAATRKAADHALRFGRLAVEARRAYEGSKRARGVLDFDDLLILTRDLLRGHAGAVRDDPARPLTFVLVDEFQDTDPVQAEILARLGGSSYLDGGLFVVGDYKQSIYGFRGARPEIFGQLRQAFPPSGRLDLSENFRSLPGVLDFVNALFAGAFPGEDVRLKPGARTSTPATATSVEFVWAEDPAIDDKSRPDADDRRRVEARWLARLIRARLVDGWPIRDPKPRTGEVRDAHAGDVAILFRAMSISHHYESALAAEGLDYHVVGGASFYARQEVFDVVNVLSVIEDPDDPIALAGALRSPFFALSDNALFFLGTARRGDLAKALRDLGQVDSLDPIDRARAERALGLLERWRGLKDRVPIATLVERVLDESGFEASLPGEFLGDRKRANARKLVRLARRYDARGGFTLAQFVGQLRDDLRKPPREDQAATTDEEGRSVRLMTIHQSKGLEFPIVVVPDLNRKRDNGKGPVVFHPDLGPLVRLGKPSATLDVNAEAAEPGGAVGWKTFRTIERAEDDAEALRLFYVATTRARDSLILSAGYGYDAKPLSVALGLLDDRFDRKTGRCLAPLPDDWDVPEVRVTTWLPPVTGRPGDGETSRPDLIRVAEAIESSREDLSTPTPLPGRPKFVDLDDARRLSPYSARLDRLIRATLADPRAFEPGALAEVVARVGRRQMPFASPELLAEALARIDAWTTGPVLERVSGASRVERGVIWSVVWPAGAGGSTVFRGRAEFVVFDALGDGTVITFHDPASTEPLERARLLLGLHAASALHPGVIREGWRVDGGRVTVEANFGAATVEAAVVAALARLS